MPITTEETTTMLETAASSEFPHNGRMTLAELRQRQEQALRDWETTHGPALAALDARIDAGRAKIDRARTLNGASEEKLKEAEEKLAGLIQEAAEIRRQYCWPTEVLGCLWGLAESLVAAFAPSEGSLAAVVIPGVIEVQVNLDRDAGVPF